MPTLEPFCTISGKLNFEPVGATPAGMRLNVPFDGSATSPHWEGERPVKGVDYVTVRGDGIAELYIRAIMGEGDDQVSYTAEGRQTADGIVETLYFQTASESLAHLNGAVGIATGGVEGNQLTLEVNIVKP